MLSTKNRTRTARAPWPLIATAVAAVGGIGLFVAVLSVSGPSVAAIEQTAAVAQPVAQGPNDLPMPPLPYVPQAAAGPPEQIREAYVFAAQNPHVLDYVPCFCGCGQSDGHVGNTDCFVGSRAPNGAVLTWDNHGMT